MALGSWPNRPADAQDRQPDGARIQRLPLGPAARCLHGSWSGSPRALFFQPLFLQICLFVSRARGIADLLHALEIVAAEGRSGLRAARMPLFPDAPHNDVHVPLLDLVDVATGERAVSTGLGAVSTGLGAAHELRLLFEGVTGIHASRAFARLTHLCRADQPNHVRTVVSSTLEISPVDVVLMWY